MQSKFVTVFDISDAGYKSLPFAAAGLLFVGLAVLMLLFPKYFSFKSRKYLEKPFKYFLLGFSIFWTVAIFISTYGEYHSARELIAQHRFNVVQGVVHDFRPMPYAGHGMERFCVEDTCFEYSDYLVTTGFNTTASHGGPIHDGLTVRVSYIGNTIIRLEIKEAAR